MHGSAAEHPTPTSLERERPVVPIVVTGSTGTIGRELVRLLATTGTELRAIYRDIRQTWAAPNVTWVRADLDDAAAADADDTVGHARSPRRRLHPDREGQGA